MNGKFITLEGGEGAGKSTQVKAIADFLCQQNIKAITTREVGGTLGAEEIRKLWLEKPENYWDSMTELLLTMAARREHLVKTIWPALERGEWVISDRFVDSARIYQGIGLGLGIEKVDAIYFHIANGFLPNLTLLLDLPVEIGLSRMKARSGINDRYQRKDIEFHKKLRSGFLELAKNEPKRFRIINAAQDQENVTKDIIDEIRKSFFNEK